MLENHLNHISFAGRLHQQVARNEQRSPVQIIAFGPFAKEVFRTYNRRNFAREVQAAQDFRFRMDDAFTVRIRRKDLWIVAWRMDGQRFGFLHIANEQFGFRFVGRGMGQNEGCRRDKRQCPNNRNLPFVPE